MASLAPALLRASGESTLICLARLGDLDHGLEAHEALIVIEQPVFEPGDLCGQPLQAILHQDRLSDAVLQGGPRAHREAGPVFG